MLLYDLISCQKTYQQKLGDSITSNLLYSTENSLFMGGKGEYALNIWSTDEELHLKKKMLKDSQVYKMISNGNLLYCSCKK